MNASIWSDMFYRRCRSWKRWSGRSSSTVEGGAKKRTGGSGSEPEALEPRAAAAEGREQNVRMDYEDEEKTADATHAGSAISRDRSSLLIALLRRRSDTRA